MRVEKTDDAILLWLNVLELESLTDSLEPVERFTSMAMFERGYDSLILDFPTSRIIAVLDLPSHD